MEKIRKRLKIQTTNFRPRRRRNTADGAPDLKIFPRYGITYIARKIVNKAWMKLDCW